MPILSEARDGPAGMTWKVYEVAWTLAENNTRGQSSWTSISYFSVLTEGKVPTNGMELLLQLLRLLELDWLSICGQAERTIDTIVSSANQIPLLTFPASAVNCTLTSSNKYY